MNSKRDINRLISNNRKVIMDGIFGIQTPVQVELSISFARYMNHVGINKYNYLFFLHIIETNNKWVIDALFGNMDPRLLFTFIKTNAYLIRRAFQLLSYWHPEQIYPKVLLAVLGIIEYSYHKSDDGYRIYKLEITDLNNLGKFLNEDKDQYDEINAPLLNILDRITGLGEYQNDVRKSIIAKHAFHIRIAFFDHKKSLLDTIPQVLLVKIPREEREVKPSKLYMSYLNKMSHKNNEG